ncbi:MAG: response regulator [Thermoanaerobaculia bacterium]
MKKRALVVDDDEPIRTMLAKIVERQNLSVDIARDGVEAVERLDSKAYDVVLLDLMMPRLDGYGVLQHMKESCPEALACTIIASAVGEGEILRQFNLPVYRIHPKPFDIGRLVADIRACVA